MTVLYKVWCKACGWSNKTRYANVSTRHCPECGKASLVLGEKPA